MANYTMTLQEINDETLYHWFIEDYPFYVNDEDAKKDFEQKFYNYYFDREIGFETVERYLMKMKGYLNLRMPYYTLLYETILKSKNIEFLLNKDLLETVKHEVKEQGTENQIGTTHLNGNETQSTTLTSTTQGTDTNSGTSSTSNTSSSTTTNKESALRDGVAQASLTDGYLTAVSEGTTNGTDSNETTQESTNTSEISQSDNQSITSTSNNTGQSQSESNNNRQLSEETTLISRGNIGVTSSASLLKEWRDVLLDMDELIIKDLEFLFMKIY